MSYSFTVDAERTIAYAQATNDPIPAHLNGELAPPVFAIVPAWDAMIAAVLTEAPGDLLPLLVHGEQDLRIQQPIIPGMTLVTTASAIGVHPKSSGTSVVVHSATTTDAGEPVNEQYLVAFIRAPFGSSSGAAAPDHTFDEALRLAPCVEAAARIDKDQTFRYAEASGDPMPIHLDDDVAKAAGLPGIIVHGLCTMAFTSWQATTALGGGDPRRLRRLAVRFSKPLLPGQEITTRFWKRGEGSYQYETTSESGAEVIKNGLVEISG